MSQNLENTIEVKKNDLEKNGFVQFEHLFSAEMAKKAHAELEVHYKRDLELRAQQDITSAHWQSPEGHFVLTEPTHLMIDGYTKSPTLDQMFETFLTHDLTKPVIEALAGKNFKLRGYNVRRMTGAYNPAPAHEWHRDSLGEFGFGILLTDIEPDENAATSFVPGSHLYPYCPRWNNLFYVPRNIIPWLVKIAPISKLLGKNVLKNHTAAFGKKGDAYIFINDTWHGRQPNLHGKEAMVVLIGAYPTDYEFPDKVTPPTADILAKLPPHVAAAASCKLPVNEMSDTILRRTIKNRIPVGTFTLWRAAQIERKLVNLLSKPYEMWNRLIVNPFNIGVYLLKRVYRRIRLGANA